jgi:C-terminal processing protease CtpA/Prc
MKGRILFGVTALIILCTIIVLAGGLNAPQQKEKPITTQRSWLGVSIQDITSQMEKAMDLKSREGALVSDVSRKSPAEAAGIKEKDVIVQFDGKNIKDADDLQKAVADTKPESKVSVVVMRKGEKKTLDVVVGKQSTSARAYAYAARPFGNFGVFGASRNLQGMSLRELNEQLGQYFGVAEGTGVLVWEVEKGSAAEKAGLKAGDVITVVGKKKIRELRDVSRALGIYDEGEKAEVEILRKGNRQTVTLEVQENQEEPGYQFWFNTPEKPRHREGAMLDGREFDLQIPDVEMPDVQIERIRPDMDRLKIEMNRLREKMDDGSIQLRNNLLRELRPKVRLHVLEDI